LQSLSKSVGRDFSISAMSRGNLDPRASARELGVATRRCVLSWINSVGRAGFVGL
jgi:hypothetical protein